MQARHIRENLRAGLRGEAMDINKAREIPLRHMSNQNQDCECKACLRCDGFVEGYEVGRSSRDAEVENLKNKLLKSQQTSAKIWLEKESE